MDQDATGAEVGLGPGKFVLDGTQWEGGHSSPHFLAHVVSFRPMCVVAKWSPMSATAVLLLYNLVFWIYQ